MAFTLTRLNKNIDRFCQFYERLRGSYDTAGIYGMGEEGWSYGAAGALADYRADMISAADNSELNALLQQANSAMDACSAVAKALAVIRGSLIKNEGLVRGLAVADGVNSIETYLTYYNTGAGGTWTALQPPQWRELFYQWKRVYPAVSNVYYEVLQAGTFRGTTFTNALRKLIVGTGTTAGETVDHTKYCGGIPQVYCSTFNGSSDTVTVTGTEFNRTTGLTTAGVTWTFTVNATGRFARVGGTASADSLIVACSNISAGANITASSVIYAECRRPTSRLAIPF